MTRVIGRKLGRGVKINPDQIPDCIAILHPVEPANSDSTWIRVGRIKFERFGLNPLHDRLALLGVRLDLGRRHDAPAHVFEHAEPQFVIAQFVVRIPLVEHHPALAGAVTVAIQTI